MSKKRRKKKRDVGVSPAPDAAGTAATQSADRMSTSLRAIERERALSRAAYELFLAEGGGDLEMLMENGQCTARAYTSQIRAAEEGGQGWGPTVTPYEDRMTRSLQLRLIKERRKWIQDCRQRIEAAIEESDVAERAAADAAETATTQSAGETPTSLRAAETATTQSADKMSTSLRAGGTPTSLRAGGMSASRITETGERLAEEARAEAAIVEEAIAMAHEEIARERGRPVARAGP